jgi:alkanesulfonate monooxygenase SsuD/methylene tetrahydromethanopterin reductase-like flavin-dependent oxidoreductase (luciferase family)
MDVGVGLPSTLAGVTGELLLNWARWADQGPFASVGVFDRLVYDSYDPLVLLAATAAVTQRVRLATTVLTGPLRNTALLAKEAASIDLLSGGRLTLGLALGARREDYDVAGIEYGRRGHRLTEQLRELRAAWSGDAAGPGPAQPGGPELLVGGMDDAAFLRAARHADGYMHGGGPVRAFTTAADKARAAWAFAGREGPPRLWGMGYFALGEEVADVGRDYLRHYYAFTGPFAERIAAGLLTTPQAVVAFVRGYAEAGCDHLVLFPALSDIEQLERLSEALT